MKNWKKHEMADFFYKLCTLRRLRHITFSVFNETCHHVMEALVSVKLTEHKSVQVHDGANREEMEVNNEIVFGIERGGAQSEGGRG